MRSNKARPSARRETAPSSPDDDSPTPALTTPRRLASEVERAAVELARVELRLLRCGVHLDNNRIATQCEVIHDIAVSLAQISGEILIGSIEVTTGRDEAAGRERYPLFVAGEEKNGTDVRAETRRPTRMTPAEFGHTFEKIDATNSSDVIPSGRIRGTLAHAGRLYVCTGGGGSGSYFLRSLDRLCPVDQWSVETYSYEDRLRSGVRGDDFFKGIVVACKGKRFVLEGREHCIDVEFTLESGQEKAKEAPAPAGAP